MAGDGVETGGGGGGLPGPRRSLVVATGTYEDPQLAQLRTPGRDAERLAAALSHPAIGDFAVRTLIDRPSYELAAEIEGFFGEARRDDVLLLHIACHGVKSVSGELHFAARNTLLTRLAATTVSAQFVNERMNDSRSRRIVLLLDCCYAGAFEHGLVSRGGGDLGLAERLGGQGRAVITASSALEYAFEDGELAGEADAQESHFTGALVRGLETGEADRDQDGLVSLEELYDYTYEEVTTHGKRQTPGKWEFGLQGTLYVARRPTPVTEAAPLLPDVEDAVGHPLPAVRASVVPLLATMAVGRHQGLALAARQALERMLQDDSATVRAAAATALQTPPAEHADVGPLPPPPAPSPSPSGRGRVPGSADETDSVPSPPDTREELPTTGDSVPAPPDTPAELPTTGDSVPAPPDTREELTATDVTGPATRSRGRWLVLGALLLVAALAAALLLWPEGGQPPVTDEEAASPATPTAPTWAPLPPPPGPVPDAPGVTEHRGELWVVSGDGSTESFAYDPDTEEWRTAPPLPREVHHGSLVSDGTSLWLIGGLHGADEALAGVYRLTDEPAGWQAGPPLPEPRFSGAAAWDGGRVVFAGGAPAITRRNRLAAPEVWALDGDGDGWVEVGQLGQHREHLAAATDATGTVWFIGGVDVVSGSFFPDVDLVAGSSVTSGPSLETPRQGVAAVWTPETGPCAMGGSTALPNEPPPVRVTTVECPDAADPHPWPDLPEATYNATGVVLDRTVYLLGGSTDGGRAWLQLSLP